MGSSRPGCFGGIFGPEDRDGSLPLPKVVPVSIPPAFAGINSFGLDGLTGLDRANGSSGVEFRTSSACEFNNLRKSFSSEAFIFSPTHQSFSKYHRASFRLSPRATQGTVWDL